MRRDNSLMFKVCYVMLLVHRLRPCVFLGRALLRLHDCGVDACVSVFQSVKVIGTKQGRRPSSHSAMPCSSFFDFDNNSL